MKKVMLKTTLGLAVTLASTQIFAAGFAINEQSISGMGTGFAGRSSVADDASTIYGNPAGMSRLKREQVTGGVALLDAHTDISHASSSPNGGTNKGDMVPFIGVPMGFYVKPIDEHWAVGIGAYAPFGLVTDYENGFAGKYFGTKSDVKVLTLQPTVSYAFNDKVSIGFGPTFNRIEGKLESDLSITQAAPDGHVRIKGDDTAVGYNIGVLAQLTDSTRVGLTYHSKVKYKLEGNTKVNYGLLPLVGQSKDQKYDASLDLTTPESVDFSVTHALDDQWTLYAGSTWTRWSRLKDITVQNDVPAPLAGSAFQTITEEQKAQITALAEDFPRLWRDPSTNDRDRKRMARLLMEDVTLRREQEVLVQIRFKGGATRELRLPLPRSARFCSASKGPCNVCSPPWQRPLDRVSS